MSFPWRKEILASPGGFYINRALDAIIDLLHLQPFRIGRRYLRQGTGSPEGVVIADRGDLFLREDGDGNTTLYFKGSGDGTSKGWVAAGASVTTVTNTTTTVIIGQPLGLVEATRHGYNLN